MKKTAYLISYLFHPLLMPTLGVFIIFYSGIYLSFIPYEAKKIILLMTAFITLFLPITLLPLLYWQKKISKITLPKRQERLIPLFVSLLFYYLAYYILKKNNIPFFIQDFILASFFCLLAVSLIHLKWKISIHMVGLGGILGLWSILSFLFNIPNQSVFLILLIVVSGLVGSARLVLKAHTQVQVYTGFLVGYILSFATLLIMSF